MARPSWSGDGSPGPTTSRVSESVYILLRISVPVYNFENFSDCIYVCRKLIAL